MGERNVAGTSFVRTVAIGEGRIGYIVLDQIGYLGNPQGQLDSYHGMASDSFVKR
jgi:hypothetical protein